MPSDYPTSKPLSQPPTGLLLAALVALAVLPFSPAIHGSFVWDDNTLLAGNVHLKAADGWRQALAGQFFEAASHVANDRQVNRQIYRPFVSLAYWLEYQAWGLGVTGYHVVNLCLHAACVVLLFFWLLRRLGGASAGWGAFLGAAVFATHPSRVESVAWISGCTDLWMALWVLVGLTLWDLAPNLPGAVGAGVAFALGFFCKEVAVVAPLALLFDEGLRGNLRRRGAQIVAAGGVVALALTLRLLHVGITGTGGVSGSPAATVLRVVATLGGYVRILLVPWPASTQVGYLLSANGGGPQVFPPLSIALGCISLVGCGALAWIAFRQPRVRPWIADLAWLLIPMLPVLNVVPLTLVTYVNERHVYLAGIGLAALIGRASLAALHVRPQFVSVASVLVVGAFAMGSVQHAVHFRSNEALWTYEAARSPENVMAVTNLMTVRLNQGRYPEAQQLASQLMRAMPRPEDKAAAYRHWLESDFSEALRVGGGELVRVRAEYDAVAAKAVPDGEAGQLYATIEEPGRRWLRRAPAFRLQRARAAAVVGDFASASRQLDALEKDAGRDSGALRPLVATLIAQRDWEGAQARIQADQLDADAARLQSLLLEARGSFESAPTEAARLEALAVTLERAGEPDMARALRTPPR